MKLSELVYQAVKNVKYLEDAGFTYQSFIDGEYDDDQDYNNSINNAMAPINEAIHRLSDRNKIAFKVAEVQFFNGSLADISSFSSDIKKIKAVFYVFPNGDYRSVSWREFNKDKLYIEPLLRGPLYVQYIQDIPAFKMDFKNPQGYEESEDIELVDYGISETMCDYIIEYVQGKLQEPIAPELANLHITRAEQYFADLEEQQVVFTQKVVHNKYRI